MIIGMVIDIIVNAVDMSDTFQRYHSYHLQGTIHQLSLHY